jgi:pimeloyl-ACP methyl ester carboxylesterase
VFVHGVLVDGRLWRDVVPLLADRFRCIVPDLPLGSHTAPMAPDADLSPPGVARLVADFVEALDLDDITLVGNDTGGAICQLVVTRHPERVGRLVLTPCDAYENFPPRAIRPLVWAAKAPPLLTALTLPFRLRFARQGPLGFGWLIKKRPLDDELLSDWLRPAQEDAGVRRDGIKVLRALDPKHTLEAAKGLRDFQGPTLLAWAPEDRFFKFRYAERLAADIPGARLERIPDSRTFVSIDQPRRLAELIGEFAA